MKVKIYTESIDHLSTNLLIVPFFPDKIPLKGTIGLLDWRLNGFISKLFMNGKISGHYFEKIMIPPFERVMAERLLLVSLGKYEGAESEKISEFIYRLMETVHKIAFSSFAISWPVELEKSETGKELIESFFRGVDRFAVKIGRCDFMNNLRITFALERERHPVTFENLSKYLGSRSLTSQALINV